MMNDGAAKELLKRYPAEQTGYWVITSGDTNPDFGGSHATHPIALLYGRYDDVHAAACKLPEFDGYVPGNILPFEVQHTNPSRFLCLIDTDSNGDSHILGQVPTRLTDDEAIELDEVLSYHVPGWKDRWELAPIDSVRIKNA